MGYDTLVVLDDDPTGTQLVHDVPVLLNVFNKKARARAFASAPKAVHVVTNSRALAPQDVRAVLRDTLVALTDVSNDAHVLLRGDSTLRAHLREEYEAVCDVKHAGRHVPLLLVPALPSAGRTTVDGVHCLTRDGTTVPLHDTEYATDGVFTYTNAHLLTYAAKRSDGLFDENAGVTMTTAELETGGPDTVAHVLATLYDRGVPAVFAPDITHDRHLQIVADGWRHAMANGVETVVRAAPAFAAVVCDTTAHTLVPLTVAHGVILMVGSYVPTTTRQLAHLLDTTAMSPIIADVVALSAENGTTEVKRLARAIDKQLHETGVAVVATPRERPTGTANLTAGEQIARNYAAALTHVTVPFDTVIAKGGITSTLTAQIGLATDVAHVVGPVATGVAQWRITAHGRDIRYLVVPGNVGSDTILTDLLAGLAPPSTPLG